MPYPTVPSRRMAYDDDGTYVAERSTTVTYEVWDEYNSSEKVAMNDEASTGVAVGLGGVPRIHHLIFLFPELREVDGFFGAAPNEFNTGTNPLQTSGNTSNGVDGTWTDQVADYQWVVGGVWDYYRLSITSLAVSNVRGVRAMGQPANSNSAWLAAHLYGEIAAGETPDRLLFVDATSGLEFTLPLDYGDIPRGSAEDQTFKLKNNSGSLSAGSVQLTTEDLYLGSASWYSYSEGGAFQATLPLAASIGSSASSPTITIRRDTPDTEDVGPHAARTQVSVGSWT